eukprot:CAMPEP_0195283290 /NCGR_PEP_ID=MMETSP0707-20130614/1886_1 /TAXON_ID=33640 /ORGANISM="Asterionellopsis glacialis, Strain CCMP134" /LENGTH=344 /DNA_ID=CAMNT_0040342429 /DNA_START=24 /DNA_END=1058 /DNA_ORIENTATION=+
MTFYQRVGKLAVMPAGAVAVATSTSILLGRRYTSSATNQTVNQAAAVATSPKLVNHAIATKNAIASTTSRTLTFSNGIAGHSQRRMFAASTTIPKDVAGLSSRVAHSPSSFTTRATATPPKGFVEWYEGHLHARPIATKAITGSILWGVGDVVAQVVPHYFFDDNPNDHPNDKHDGAPPIVPVKQEFHYDSTRTARAVFFGFALHAPLSHFHFNFLEWMTVKGGFQGLSIPVFKTVMEQFVYWSWISNSLYHGAMGAMQGMSFGQMYDRIADVLWDTQVAQWSFWIPVQLLNFKFVPVRHQLNVVLLTSVVWTALLSAWYPPSTEEKDTTKDDHKSTALTTKES